MTTTKGLTIGDWLFDKNGLPKRVTEVYDDSVSMEGELNHMSTINPIQLNSNVLEANGFKLVKNGEEWHRTYIWRGNKNWDSCEVTFCDNGGLIIRIESNAKNKSFGINDVHNCDIEYVHELQHAFYLCGVEKEVVL